MWSPTFVCDVNKREPVLLAARSDFSDLHVRDCLELDCLEPDSKNTVAVPVGL